jgi:hypothetical protein
MREVISQSRVVVVREGADVGGGGCKDAVDSCRQRRTSLIRSMLAGGGVRGRSAK